MDKLSNVTGDWWLHADVRIWHMACASVKCGFIHSIIRILLLWRCAYLHFTRGRSVMRSVSDGRWVGVVEGALLQGRLAAGG